MSLIRDAQRIDPAHAPADHRRRPACGVSSRMTCSARIPRIPAAPTSPSPARSSCCSACSKCCCRSAHMGESMRSAFDRTRDSGALDDIPGLVYPRGERDGVPEELVDTGIQRLLGDLDELPHPVLGYRLARTAEPAAHAGLPAIAGQIAFERYSPISSLVLTFGCKFACPYCPIPAYNQRQHRLKSGERIADEMWRLNKEYGLRYFFGADDNFFNSKQRTLDIVETLASERNSTASGSQRKARWYTEVTVHDTLQMKEHLPLVHDSGCRALWLGVEDMTATLVNKGQSVDKTIEAFRLLRSGHLPDADDDASRFAAALFARAPITACSIRSGCCERPARSRCRC